MTDYFSVENGAHQGDYGQNRRREPSRAQQVAGNYKKGRVDLHGLAVVVEQPRGSYRSGVGADGKAWRTQLAAHYGYFPGTLGNDGDPVDCFVGDWVHSTVAYVVNQFVGGEFDEHKVMLGFVDEEAAMLAYQLSFEHGWKGLHSRVACTVEQLRWWLKHGNQQQALRPEHLPYAGRDATKPVYWDANAQPDQPISRLLYRLRKGATAATGDPLLDALTLAEGMAGAEAYPVLDALVRPLQALPRTAEVMRRVMNRTGQGVTAPTPAQTSPPFMRNGTAQVLVLFELSDGQTVSIYFHNPDTTPKKIAQTDDVVSWKWLLNKKDITIMVAPEQGRDLNVNEVARRVMRLAEHNSAAFQRANQRRAAQMQRISQLETEIGQLEQRLAGVQPELFAQ